MERYSEYKDSGVKWLGEIPSHWEVRKSKYLWKETFSISETGNEDLLSVSQYEGVTPAKGESRSESLIGYKRVSENDLVINIMLAWLGGLGVSKYQGVVSPAYCIYKLCANSDSRFLHYLYKTPLYLAEFARHSTGVVPSRWRMYTDEFGQVLTLLPPIEEQKAIANYLDSVTSKIDEAIAQQQKMIDLLNERKQIIINNAVTKGLDPNVKMKPSGVDWIGEIPEHWKVVPVRRITSSHLQGYYDPNGYVDNGYRLLRITDLQEGGKVTFEQAPFVKHTSSIKDFLLRPGDFCFARTGGAGSFGYISEIKEPAVFASYLIRFRFVNQDNDYLRYYFLSKNFKDEIQSLIHGGVNQNIHAENIKDAHITIPPIYEQRDIVSYIETNCKPINEAARVAYNQIFLLQERKQIIINDVVTGKVKVV